MIPLLTSTRTVGNLGSFLTYSPALAFLVSSTAFTPNDICGGLPGNDVVNIANLVSVFREPDTYTRQGLTAPLRIVSSILATPSPGLVSRWSTLNDIQEYPDSVKSSHVLGRVTYLCNLRLNR